MRLRDRARAWWTGSQRAHPRAPPFWREHLRRYGVRRQATSTPIEEVRFVVLDTEATGLDHRRDHVVSFGAVRARGGVIDVATAVDWRIRTKLPSPEESIVVHGVLNAELEGGLPPGRFAERLTAYLGADVIVGYRPGFDMALLNRLIDAYTGGRLDNPTLDVFELGMRVDYPLKPGFVNPEPYAFDALCRRYGLETPERHTAIGDAYTTALLLCKLLYRLREGGASTLADLLRAYR